MYLLLQAKYRQIESKCYLHRGSYRKFGTGKFQKILETDWMKDQEFLYHYRVSREAFNELVEKIKDHPVFHHDNPKKQAPPANELLVLLKYLGTSGNGCRDINLADHFEIGQGTVYLFIKRALKTIISLQSRAIIWPDMNERTEIANRIQLEYGFPNCIGIIDGTLLPLEFKPTIHGETYHSRKQNYAINMLVVVMKLVEFDSFWLVGQVQCITIVSGATHH